MGAKRLRNNDAASAKINDESAADKTAGSDGESASAIMKGVFTYSNDRLSRSDLNPPWLLNKMLSPLELVERDWRKEIWPLLAVFFFAFCLYGITSPRKVTLEDDGLFLMNMEYFGVGHPPGYPLYTMLGGLFYHMMPDFLPPALRGHLFSGFCAAVACSAVYYCVSLLTRGNIVPLMAGLAYAVSDTFWSQAIISEVYAPNAMIYFIILAMCLRYASHRGPPTKGHRTLYAAIALTYGLGLSNHWPLLGLGSPALLLIVISQWRTLITRLPIGIVCLALGLIPYLWMIWRSSTDVPINFYGEIKDLKELWFYVTRQGYAGVDNQSGVGLEEKLAFTNFFFFEFSKQISWVGFAAAIAGMVAMLRSRAHCYLAVCLLVAMFMTGPLLILLIDFKAEFIWFSAFRVYHLLCYGILVIFFGYALASGAEYLLVKLRQPDKARLFAAGLGAFTVVCSMILHWGRNNRSDYSWANETAMVRLLSVEPNTQLFSYDDLDLPVAYLNYVENVRPDVTVYNDQGLVFGNRVYTPFTNKKQRARALSNFIDKNPDSPVYYHPYRQELFKSGSHGSDLLGFWRRVNRDGPNERVILSDRMRWWLDNNLEKVDSIEDRWTKHNIYGNVASLVNTIEQALIKVGETTPSFEWQETINLANKKNPLVRLTTNWRLVEANSFSETQAREELEWIDQTLSQRRDDQELSNAAWADMLSLKAQIFLSYPQLAETDDLSAELEEILLTALDYEFTPVAFAFLSDILRGQDRHEDLIKVLKEEFPAISRAPPLIREVYNLIIKEQKEGRLLRPVTEVPQIPNET